MSGGIACKCSERKKPARERAWKVVQYMSNRSAFNGYRETQSLYSEIVCTACGARWRTKADYVLELGHL